MQQNNLCFFFARKLKLQLKKMIVKNAKYIRTPTLYIGFLDFRTDYYYT